MKRCLIMFMVLGLIAGSVATAEAKKSPKRVERTVEANYGPYPSPVTGCNGVLEPFACLVVPTWASEAFFTAKVTDLHGQPVFVQVKAAGRTWAFCGETTHPIAFEPGSSLFFYLAIPGWPGEVMLDCPANRIKTSGTISVTLSNLELPEPVLSGSIVSGTGWVLDGLTGGCQISPECAAWLQSGCDQTLELRNPGLTASIVDVDELADGPPIERVFRFGPSDAGLVWGGVQLQFWSSDCVEIPRTRWRSTDCRGDETGVDCSSLRFRIPPEAKWMTVTGYQDNVNLAWTLT
jgi:hypothetical protein